MLIGRDAELLHLERLLAGARTGASAVLVVRGEPGIGKSALLEGAAVAASGMRVLRARGVESEVELPFSGLHELLRPLLGALDDLPAPQAEALRTALALGEGPPSGPFAVGAATLSLLATSAEREPLLVLVDDLHWLDGASASAVAFAARRLVADPVAVVMGVRDGHVTATDGAGLPELVLGGLDAGAARALLARSAPGPVTPEVADWAVGATGGNPLALVELAAEAPGLRVDLFDRPAPAGDRVRAGFTRRLAGLSDGARRLLVVAAASEGGGVETLARAAEALGIPMAALDEAEAAGFVRLEGGTVEFRHPLVRSVAYGAAEPAERRAAHAALADAASAEGSADRGAWHRAAAAIRVDEDVAGPLAAASERALARGGYAAAATGMERAAQLTPDPATRAARLHAAADAAWLAGAGPHALELLEEARAGATEPALRGAVAQLRGRILARRGPVAEAHDVLVEGAEEIAAIDPATAAEMLAEAAMAFSYVFDPPGALATAERAVALAPEGNDRATCLALTALGTSLVFAGRGAEGASRLRRAVALLESSAELIGDPRMTSWTGIGQLFLRERGVGFDLLARAAEGSRRRGALGVLSQALLFLAIDAATSDRWSAARALYAEGIDLARETDNRVDLGGSLAGLARVEARRGREDACRAAAGEALALSVETGARWYEVWARWALADLDLALGRPDAAAAGYAELLGRLEEWGLGDADLSPAPELVEALVQLGRPEDARAPLAAFERQAAEKGQPWALARAARARGLLADEGAFETAFAQALGHGGRTTDAFELARTRLAYGERLRRQGRRVRARDELRTAFDAFEDLGAEPWAERARNELRATGETARRREVSTLDDLTPQELQIASILAGGATTREAASRLYLSPKTIEYHLRNAYRKLGVNTRAALAEALGGAPPDQSSSEMSAAARAAPSLGTGR
jgi:DNA-binding CsgD family transcriptional regulator